jgi:undecaprenyl-diphosphatase
MQTWHVILLGLIEGLTEFIPVSSTGHLLLAGHFLGFDSPGKSFEVLIQLGAILAILTVYAAKLWRLLLDLPRDARTRPSTPA